MIDKKVAIVTGSRKGIGLGIAKILGSDGYLVVISSRAPLEEVQSLLTELKEMNLEVDYRKCDITCSKDRKDIVDYVIHKYGRLDVLVNNAGIAPDIRMDLLETTEESYDKVLNTNLKGTYFMCQVAANAMIECQKSTIPNYIPRMINISSMSAYTSSILRGEYCVSKAGISMITKLFADRLSEYSIPVFEVRPGLILTDMTEAVKEKYENLINEGVTPIKRFGYPEDVGNCVKAACSGLLDFGTGQILNADGGFHIRRI